MKKPFSFKLPIQMAGRVDRLMAASGLKRNTILELALEMHLPALEAKYQTELAGQSGAAPINSVQTGRVEQISQSAAQAALNESGGGSKEPPVQAGGPVAPVHYGKARRKRGK